MASTPKGQDSFCGAQGWDEIDEDDNLLLSGALRDSFSSGLFKAENVGYFWVDPPAMFHIPWDIDTRSMVFAESEESFRLYFFSTEKPFPTLLIETAQLEYQVVRLGTGGN